MMAKEDKMTTHEIGGKRVALVCLSFLWLAGVCFSQAAVSISPKVGPPTTKVLVSGSGFTPNGSVDIYFDTTDLAHVGTDSSGSFSNTPIQVPASALPGQHS